MLLWSVCALRTEAELSLCVLSALCARRPQLPCSLPLTLPRPTCRALRTRCGGLMQTEQRFDCGFVSLLAKAQLSQRCTNPGRAVLWGLCTSCLPGLTSTCVPAIVAADAATTPDTTLVASRRLQLATTPQPRPRRLLMTCAPPELAVVYVWGATSQ